LLIQIAKDATASTQNAKKIIVTVSEWALSVPKVFVPAKIATTWS
jgi:hypothetical protein